MSSIFTKALLLGALAATSVEAKRGRTFEANAFVTPKRENKAAQAPAEPYLQQNLLNLRQDNDYEDDGTLMHDVGRTYTTGGQEDLSSHIITTSDIDNYFNLQITTKLYFGSN